MLIQTYLDLNLIDPLVRADLGAHEIYCGRNRDPSPESSPSICVHRSPAPCQARFPATDGYRLHAPTRSEARRAADGSSEPPNRQGPRAPLFMRWRRHLPTSARLIPISRSDIFETARFNHSRTSPTVCLHDLERRRQLRVTSDVTPFRWDSGGQRWSTWGDPILRTSGYDRPSGVMG